MLVSLLQQKVMSGDQSSKHPEVAKNTISAYINSFYSAKTDIGRYIFTDIKNQAIYTTTDFGHTFNNVTRLAFVPDVISIHLTKPWIVLALDKTNPSKALYKSDDFGRTWREIQQQVKEFEWGYSGKILAIFKIYLKSTPVNTVMQGCANCGSCPEIVWPAKGFGF